MGIVKRQAFYNSIINYVGIIIGYVNVVILFPFFFSVDQFGLTRILVAISSVYSQFASLGAYTLTVKFFPFFKTENKDHNGFFSLVILISTIGFLIATVVFLFFRDEMISLNNEKSSLLIDNYYLTIPLAFFTLSFLIFEGFLQSIFKTIITNFLKHVVLMVLWMLDIFLFHLGWIDYDLFIIFFVLAQGIITGVAIVYLAAIGHLKLSLRFLELRKKAFKLMTSYSLFSILSGASNILINRIDIIMLGFMTELANTGVYSIALYIATIVTVPSQAIIRIAYPIISSRWKQKNLEEIEETYKKSSLVQLLLGGFIISLIWINIDDILNILPTAYVTAKYAILCIGISKLFDMAAGVNGLIIVTSKHYKFDTLFSSILVLFTILTNLILIPEYGITGAALATAISLLLYNLMKFVFVMVKFRMQPFSWATLYGILVLIGVYILVNFIPDMQTGMVNIIIKSFAFSLLYFLSLYLLKISPDINDTVNQFLKRFLRS